MAWEAENEELVYMESCGKNCHGGSRIMYHNIKITDYWWNEMHEISTTATTWLQLSFAKANNCITTVTM